jgi:hypothetical protein
VKGPFLPNASSYSPTTTSRQPTEAGSRFRESNPKIEELRLLLANYASQEEASLNLEWAKIGLRKGNEKFLNDKLQQLRALAKSQDWRPF